MTHIIEWLSAVVGGLVLIAGFLYSGLWFLEKIMRAVQTYRFICEYFWHRGQFREWLKTNCEHSSEGSK